MRISLIFLLFFLCVEGCISQKHYCYSSDTVQSSNNFIQLIVDSFDSTDVTKALYKVETAKPIHLTDLRFSVGTADILLKKSIDYQVVNDKIRLLDDPFLYQYARAQVELYVSYEFSSAGPLIISQTENELECPKTRNDYSPLISKWDSLLLNKNIVPSKDAIELMRAYNGSRVEQKDSLIYPEFVKINPKEEALFAQEYLTDIQNDSRLVNSFKKAVVKMGSKIQESIEGLRSRGEINNRDYMRMLEFINHKQDILIHLSRLHEALDDIISWDSVSIMPKMVLQTAIDEINNLSKIIPEVKDKIDEENILKFIEDIQLLTYPFAPKYLQHKSYGGTSGVLNLYTPTAGEGFHYARYSNDRTRYLRQFHFYVFKNFTPTLKKEYRVYCVPEAVFLQFEGGSKDLNNLSLYMCQTPASVASRNLPIGNYYFFAVKIGDTKWSSQPQKYNTGQIVRNVADEFLPYSFCIDVKN